MLFGESLLEFSLPFFQFKGMLLELVKSLKFYPLYSQNHGIRVLLVVIIDLFEIYLQRSSLIFLTI